MLLAALEALRRAYPKVPFEALMGRLHGFDLDPRAVEVTRRTLKLEAGRVLGRRDKAIEAGIDARIEVRDGLEGDPGPYDIVLTNPPYMGLRSMPTELKQHLRQRYAPYHGDLYSAFILRCHRLARHRIGVLAQQTLWYLSSFAEAREHLLTLGDLLLFMHLGPHAFESLTGEKANVVAFVQAARQQASPGAQRQRQTLFIDLRDLGSARVKRDAYADLLRDESSERVKATAVEVFSVIPKQPIAHWLPPALRQWFDRDRFLGDLADVPGRQNKTGDNGRFVRSYDELSPEQIRRVEALWPNGSDDGQWVFYSKGGRFAPWWGNWSQVVDWTAEARAFYADHRTANLLPEVYWYREGLCYTDFGGAHFNARWMPPGCLFDMAGPAIFTREPGEPGRDVLFALLAIVNSTAARELLNALNPTLHYQVRDVRRLPLPELDPAILSDLATSARALVDDLRLIHRLLPGDPLYAPDLSPDDQARILAILENLPGREQSLDAMVCALYGVPDLAIGPRPQHGAALAIAKTARSPQPNPGRGTWFHPV
jgi:hypothetical protein